METNAVEKTEVETTAGEKHEARKANSLRHQARANSRARFSVLVHVVAFVTINLLLAFINMMTFAGHWWVLWPLFGWGIGLLCHAVAALLVPSIGSVRRRLYHEELDRLTKA